MNLTSGAATLVGSVGAGVTPVLDIATPRPPTGAYVALGAGNVLVAFDASSPTALGTQQTITGLTSGETVVGFDVRPATGELFAVAVNGATGRMYRIDPATAVAT